MKIPTFQIYEQYGEEGEQIFYINGNEVGRCDHDSHGWSGMEAVRRMFENTAAIFGVDNDAIEILDEELS
jgi:hypothetical protein